MVAPPFVPFVTGVTETAAYIGDRTDKREHMKRNGLVEWDAGVTNAETWVDRKEAERQYIRDFQAVEQMSEDRRRGLLHVDADTGGAGDIDPAPVPIVKDVSDA